MVALAFILGAQSSTNQQQSQNNLQQISISSKGKLLSKRDESARHDEASSSESAFESLLSKVNPWLSACDLAQPNSAPDLQVRKFKIFHSFFTDKFEIKFVVKTIIDSDSIYST
jgi:hypothetical protein